MSLTIESLKQELRNHVVYGLIADLNSLQTFMESHVVAVWDFMSLVKSLQAGLCGHSLPWIPPQNAVAARLINEIVLCEETDDVNGRFKSHFELYLDAMTEVGCNLEPILSVVKEVSRSRMTHSGFSLENTGITPGAKAFAQHTLSVLHQPLHIQAAVFFHSRENIIPAMFTSMIHALASKTKRCDIMLDYLERHVHTDSEVHGPMAQQLLEVLYDGQNSRVREGEAKALEALLARKNLWDSIAENILFSKTAQNDNPSTAHRSHTP